MQAILKRRSVRDYLDIPVDEYSIEKILKSAMAAPSACNQQPWEYYVVTDKAKLQELAACSPYAGCTAKAPMAFVACYRNTGLICPEYAHIDMAASVENLLLEIADNRLGAVWLGIAPETDRMANVARVLNLPTNLTAFAIIPCGYPSEYPQTLDRYEEARVHRI